MPNYDSGVPVPVPGTSWSDIPLSTSVQVKAAHTTELRSALTSLKTHYHNFPHAAGSSNSGGPSPAIPDSWTDAPLDVHNIHRKAIHVNELITAIKATDGHTHDIPLYDTDHTATKTSNPYAPGFTYLKDPIVAGADKPRSDIFNQLRSHLNSLASHIHTACCECECTCTCECQCTCECTCECTCTCTCKGCN